MKQLISLIIIFIASLYSCQNSRNIEGDELRFVNALIKDNKDQYIISLDSVINLPGNSDALLSFLFYKKGVLKLQMHRQEESIQLLKKALELFKKHNNEHYVAKTYWLLGSANAYLSNKVIANEQLVKALHFNKEIQDKKLEANIYGSLAHIHYLYNDFDKSVDYILKTIKVYESQNDTLGLSSTYNNLAVIYKNQDKYDEAFLYNSKSLKLNLLTRDTNAIAKSHNNIGAISENKKDYASAIEHYLLAAQLNNTKQIMNSSPLQNLGNLHLLMNNTKLAKKYLHLALNIENAKNQSPKALELNSKLLQIALKEDDTQNVIYHQKVKDSLNNIKVKKEAQENLELVEKQFKLAASQQELELEQQINSKNQFIFIFIIGFTILASLFWYQFQRNKQLRIEKEKIKLEQQVLRSQMNPHFIFNAMSSIQNSLMDSDPIKSAKHLSNFAKLIRQNFDFVQKKSITLEEEISALESYLKTQQFRLNNKFDYKIDVDENINIHSTEIPPLLLQPFLENAIEHGFKNINRKGLVTLNIKKKDNRIFFEIIDNGKSISNPHKDGKLHSIDIFKKRLQLIGNNDEETFRIKTADSGTTITFSLSH